MQNEVQRAVNRNFPNLQNRYNEMLQEAANGNANNGRTLTLDDNLRRRHVAINSLHDFYDSAESLADVSDEPGYGDACNAYDRQMAGRIAEMKRAETKLLKAAMDLRQRRAAAVIASAYRRHCYNPDRSNFAMRRSNSRWPVKRRREGENNAGHKRQREVM
jgi:hypothetical protein